MKPAPRPLPAEGPLLAFLGDDFTGASAAMEALAFAGLETVLFLDLPTPERLAAFPGARGIGVASVARARPPEWMDAHLPEAFARLGATGAPMLHYKLCSTFDSAPHVGSIGRALELAARQHTGWFPMVVADAGMGRYQCFGHLFAATPDGVGHRLDRHPVMARHPVTPMDEADLARHLVRQTALPTGLVDFTAMKRPGGADAQLRRVLEAGARVVFLDVMDQETLAEAGRLIWENPEAGFAFGSQGVEAALVAHWRRAGLLAPCAVPVAAPARGRIACVSGSVSPVTAGQIADALAHGFTGIRLAIQHAIEPRAWRAELERATQAALSALSAGQDALVFTATGPDDAAVPALSQAIASSGANAQAVHDSIGEGLGDVLDALLRQAGLRRAVIAGGDSSGHAMRRLGFDALTALAPLAPGSPLCRAHAPDDTARDGLEIALKGGQVGQPDFFRAVRDGMMR